jgi:MerR family transcriptional regulator, light-induced transcriptional regulator
MYTIKQAARLSGVSEASLRAWERRYGVVVPLRNGSGYRVYSREDLAAVSTMRRLVNEGWSPAEAANAVRTGTLPAEADQGAAEEAGPTAPKPSEESTAATLRQLFLSAAARLDTAGIEESLDGAFALGSFEHVVDSWLFPALAALGEGWANAEIDVAGEHMASHAVHRRLSSAFEAAGSSSRGPAVVVGLPSGSQHDLGALAFATAIRRRGLDILYLGAGGQLGGGGTQPRRPSRSPGGRHSRRPPRRARGGRATAQPRRRTDRVQRWLLRGTPDRGGREPGSEHRGRRPSARRAPVRRHGVADGRQTTCPGQTGHGVGRAELVEHRPDRHHGSPWRRPHRPRSSTGDALRP